MSNSEPNGRQKARNKAESKKKKGLKNALNRVCAFIGEQLCGVMIFDIVINVQVREGFQENALGGVQLL